MKKSPWSSTFVFPCPSHCIKVFQMLISQLSLITEGSCLELEFKGGSSEIPKEHSPGFVCVVGGGGGLGGGEDGARYQNLGHLCNVICICVKVFQMLISRQSLIIKHSYLKLGYLGGSSEIPKEHIPGFLPGDGAWGQNLGNFVVCYMHFHYAEKL